MPPPIIIDPVLCQPARLAALAQSGVEAERKIAGMESLDRLSTLVARVLRVPVALVSLVDDKRQVFPGKHGKLPEPFDSERETQLSHSFCQHVVISGQPLVINDSREDARVSGNAAVRDLNVIAYLGIPLQTVDGHVLGSLCAIDTVPRQWEAEDIDALLGLASFATTELEVRRSGNKVADILAQTNQNTQAGREDRMQLLVHDLRTPLNSMLLSLQTLPLLGELNEDQREALELADRGGQALVALVDDILDFGAAEAAAREGKVEVRLEEVDPCEILATAGQQVIALARVRGIRFVAETSSLDLGAHKFQADRDKLVRALVNLLGNAIKFTPDKGTISTHVRLMENGQTVEFSVQDTGRGIARKDFGRIFEKFVRVGGDIKGSVGHSSGVGLAFCKLVAEAHGGVIEVESELGQGSLFTMRLPCLQGDTAASL